MGRTQGIRAIRNGLGAGTARLLLLLQLFGIEETSPGTSCPLHRVKMARLVEVGLSVFGEFILGL